MVKLIGMLSRFNPVNVLVIGDFMLDTYTTGNVRRISPEAPVSVFHVEKEESLPGGAGNVVLNLTSLGANVTAVGRIGKDSAGEELLHFLQSNGVQVKAMLTQENFKTPVKNRLIAGSQQVIRVDFENVTPIPESLEQAIINKLPEMLDSVQIVAISDYGKGFLSSTLLESVMELAKERNIPVIVDPKGIDFSKYQGATVIKPNLSEAYAASMLPEDAALDKVAKTLLKLTSSEMVLITRSESGMSLFNKEGKRFDFPVRAKEVNDVTGAGDTVLAMISVALANGMEISIAAQLANIAASMAIERLGCARISLSELATRLLEYDIENKIFDEEHLFALQQALSGKQYTVLGLDSRQGMTTPLFRTIRKLSTRSEKEKLILYIKDNEPDEEFVILLSSLAEVDFIVLSTESLKNLCEVIHPLKVYSIETSRLITHAHPTALLEA